MNDSSPEQAREPRRRRISIAGIVALLVGACLLALLAYGVAGVVRTSKDEARMWACLSNLKLVMQATQMYATDHSDHFPPSDSWPTALSPYLKASTALLCPADRRAERQGVGDLRTSYTMNLACGGAEAKMGKAGDVPVLWDGEVLSGGRGSLAPRHWSHMANVGFADGYVKGVIPQVFETLSLTPSR